MSRGSYSKESLERAAASSGSVEEVLAYLGVKFHGSTWNYCKAKLTEYGVDTSHFRKRGHNGYLSGKQTKTHSADTVFVVLPEGSRRTDGRLLAKYLIESGIEYRCSAEGCSIVDEWLGKPVKLQVDHTDGNWRNNLIENLRFLCPMCHSQTETFNRGTVAQSGGASV